MSEPNEAELSGAGDLPRGDHEYESNRQLIYGIEDKKTAQFFKWVGMGIGVGLGIKSGSDFEVGNTFYGATYAVLGAASAYLSTRLAQEEVKASGQQGSNNIE